MPKTTRIQYQYHRNEVVAAQQLRYRNSPRLQVVFIFGIISLLVLVARPWLPFLQTNTYLAGTLPILAVIFFLLTPLVFYFLAPIIDFKVNREWRHPYKLEISSDLLRLARSGSDNWVNIDLRRLRRLYQNRLVFVLIFSSEQDFFILPKRALSEQGHLDWVSRLVYNHLPKKKARPGRPG